MEGRSCCDGERSYRQRILGCPSMVLSILGLGTESHLLADLDLQGNTQKQEDFQLGLPSLFYRPHNVIGEKPQQEKGLFVGSHRRLSHLI